MKIGIIAAMSSEREQLAGLLEGARVERNGRYEYTIGQLGVNTLYLMECGIGKVNAAVGAAELIGCVHPDAVISTGVAGGIDASVGVMDVVASSQVVYHDVWCGEGNALGQVQGLPPVVSCGGIASCRHTRAWGIDMQWRQVHYRPCGAGDHQRSFSGRVGCRHGVGGHCAGMSPVRRAVHQFPYHQRHAGGGCPLAAVRKLLANHGRPFVRRGAHFP